MKNVKIYYIVFFLVFSAIGCTREAVLVDHDAELSVFCGFTGTRLSHSEDGGFFKSEWTKGDTITVVINDEVRYYIADADGASTSFSLSDEHDCGFSSYEGVSAFAITGKVDVKDGCYALLKGDMGRQAFKQNGLPLDYQTSHATVTKSSVSFVFSYPHSYMKMLIPKRRIDAAGGNLHIQVDGDFPFYLSNDHTHWASDVVLINHIANPATMPVLDGDSWASQSRAYPHLMINLRENKYLSYYESGSNFYNYDNCLTYSFSTESTNSYNADDLVAFFVAFSPNIRLIPMEQDRYMISVYPDDNRNEKMYEKIVPLGKLSTNTIYEVNLTEQHYSTDYSKDGTVVTLQQASVGNGIDLVFFGEGYTDLEMGDDGLYEQDMKEAAEKLFSYEPLSSLKDRFNLYCVKVVSPYHNAIAEASPLNQLETLVDYYNNIPSHNGSVYRAIVVQRFASDFYKNDDGGNSGEASFCVQYMDGSFIVRMRHRSTYQHVLFHEFCHGIAKLADEYEYFDEQHDVFPEDGKAELTSLHEMGWRLNVDSTNNPDEVIWSRLLKDERFAEEGYGFYYDNPDIANEGLGVFEGGMYYVHGIYRPSYYSVMNNNTDQAWLNAPSREAIYKHIMSMSEGNSWEYDYEDFVAFDEPYRRDVKNTRDGFILHLSSARKPIKHLAPIFGGEDIRHSLIHTLDCSSR